MGAMSPLRAEARKLASLGIPVAATQVSTMLMGVVDTAMVGRVSVEALAAASLANVWTFATMLFAAGMIFGLDPIVSQAHGARDGKTAGVALQRGVVLALLLSIPVGFLWGGTEFFLLLVGQDPELARAAHGYALAKLPGIPFFLVYSALRQYLQGRELVRPAMWVILIANVFNGLFNWVLIFGHLGFPALGLVGAGIATSLTRVVSLVGLVLWVRGFSLHRGAWVPWTRSAVQVRRVWELAAVGFPVAVQMSTEMWAFSAAALLAGRLGAEPLAAHTIAMNLAGLAFMVPLGISQGAATRVGNLLGAGRPGASQFSARVSLGLGAAVMTISATFFVLGRATLPKLYTPDPALIALCATILPIAAAFQIFDGTQVVACGEWGGPAPRPTST
jgi:MATE family multidrug resistance protein